MKPLMKSELKEGHIYQCLISNRIVFISSITKESAYIAGGVEGEKREWFEVFSYSYNPVTGHIEPHPIHDNSLSEIFNPMSKYIGV